MPTRHALRPTTLILAVAAALPAASALPAFADPVAWKPFAPGIERASIESPGETAAPFRLAAFRIDLARFEPRAVLAKDHGGPIATAEALADATGATLVVNGPFFDERDVPLGLLVSSGRRLRPLRKADWGVLYVAGGRAALLHTTEWKAAPPERVTFAIQVGPRTVVRGRVQRLKPQVARRAAVCVPPGGTSLVVAATDLGVAESNDLARLMAAPAAEGGLGCADALMMDGGPSAQLSARAGSTRVEVHGGRGVPAAIGFFERR
ncbi:MAG: phosphodiester glycosidase family protein [Deltaproteobacteria bacterium]|nr:phosphodiester glycosidase family protein [Deltaproteobacteria bacterium]